MESSVQDTVQLLPMPLNEVRAADNRDFHRFQQLLKNDTGWQQRYNKNGTRVFTKLSDEYPVKIIKVVSDLKETSIDAVFDTLHDPKYRKKWDEHMLESKDICKLDANNDIGYYAVRMPKPLKNRDFLMQRSWTKSKGQFVIFSHSVQHKAFPVRREYLRASCFVSGYMGESDGDCGCRITYVSQIDPRGRLPKWLVNRVSTRVAPKIVEKLRKAALNYASWKSNNLPDWKPWMTPEQNELPDLDSNDVILDDSPGHISELVDESAAEE